MVEKIGTCNTDKYLPVYSEISYYIQLGWKEGLLAKRVLDFHLPYYGMNRYWKWKNLEIAI